METIIRVALLLLLMKKSESFTINKISDRETRTTPQNTPVPSLPPKDNSTANEEASHTATPLPDLPYPYPYPVRCSDDDEFCECPGYKSACMFVLIVEELQTFTSYKYEDKFDTDLGVNCTRIITTKRTKGSSSGDTYYLNGRGFTPSLPPPLPDNRTRPPEYGKCYNDGIKSIIDERTFKEMKCTVPTTVDGSTYRMFIGVNGRIPGPTLIMHEGQVVQIRVHNKLSSEGITIHWHGMHQKNTPWMDGVGLVSQPPIVPGAHFDYIFKAFPPGTHWYHSHVGVQRTDGLYGAFVVKELNHHHYPLLTDNKIIDSPEQHTISLLDWEREASLNLFVRIHSTLGFFPNQDVGRVPTQLDSLYRRTRSTDGVEVGPVPFWSGLMNGKGRHSEDTFSRLSIFKVAPRNKYRFRLVGAQGLYAFKFSVQKHRLTLIASDGHFIEPVELDYIIIHTGERYDFVLHSDQEPSNYWMRAETLEANADRPHLAEGVLHYLDGKVEEPNPMNKYGNVLDRPRGCNKQRRCVAVNCPFRLFPPSMHTDCLQLDHLYSTTAATAVGLPQILIPGDDNLKFFNFGFEGVGATSAINGKNFGLPSTPYQTYCRQVAMDERSGKVCTSDEFTYDRQCINIARIAERKRYDPRNIPSVNFVLSSVGNFTARNNDFSHPIHLHGHTFQVVAVGHGKYDEATGELVGNNEDVDCGYELSMCTSPRWKNDKVPPDVMRDGHVRKNAIFKDTVIVPAGGYVVIAFKADNPGYWFMHCHIESHQLEGMAVIVQEYPPGQQWLPPKDINRVGDFSWSVESYATLTQSYPLKCDNP